MYSKVVNAEGIEKKIDMEIWILLNNIPNVQREQ
jgi:hypothetical protein